jgi:hypothetical protein
MRHGIKLKHLLKNLIESSIKLKNMMQGNLLIQKIMKEEKKECLIRKDKDGQKIIHISLED